jgi:hypothetical protein
MTTPTHCSRPEQTAKRRQKAGSDWFGSGRRLCCHGTSSLDRRLRQPIIDRAPWRGAGEQAENCQVLLDASIGAESPHTPTIQ